MDTLSSVKRTAVRLSIPPCRAALAAALVLIPGASLGQDLFDALRASGAPGAYVFVSERLADTALIPLARDARRAGFTLVVNGFWGDLDATRQRVARINAACCGSAGAHWQVNPLLFERYHIAAVPSFVLAVGPGAGRQDFSKVTGEISVANALKFFAQQSALPVVRRQAAAIYTRAFSIQ